MIEIEVEAIKDCCSTLFENSSIECILESVKRVLEDLYELSFPNLHQIEQELEKNPKFERDYKLIDTAIEELAVFFSEDIEEEFERKKKFLDFLESIIFETKFSLPGSLSTINLESLRDEIQKNLVGRSNIIIDKNFGILINCCSNDKMSISFRYDVPEIMIRSFVEGVYCYSKGFYRGGYVLCSIAFEAVLKHYYEIERGKYKFIVEYVDTSGEIIRNKRDVPLNKLLKWVQKTLSPADSGYKKLFRRLLINRNSIVHLKINEDISKYEILTDKVKNDFPTVFSVVADYINNIFKTLIE